ncbi:MAG TPA: hypothetical protein VLF89_06000 [Candidatus Saccharimonadales bacterium]|nr:hypothetical protein [Candidatus Saccharimonadales bacterium]
MAEKLTDLSLTINPDHARISPSFPEGNKFMYLDAESAFDDFLRLHRTYEEIAAEADYPDHIIYPAGSADVFPMLMPQVSSVTIVDTVPFLAQTVGETGHNSYSPVFVQKLREHEGTYIDLDELANADAFTPTMHNLLTEDITDKTREHLRDQIYNGYHANATGTTGIFHDNFAKILGSLLVMGVDLPSVRLGRFANEYRLHCELEGEKKLLVYRNQRIHVDTVVSEPDIFKPPKTAPSHQNPAKTALLSKADFDGTAQKALVVLKPDVIISDRIITTDKQPLQANGRTLVYDYTHLPHPSFPKRLWGYRMVGDINIGKRRMIPTRIH